MARFVQTFPPLPDVYASDHVLRATLARLLGEVGAGHRGFAHIVDGAPLYWPPPPVRRCSGAPVLRCAGS